MSKTILIERLIVDFLTKARILLVHLLALCFTRLHDIQYGNVTATLLQFILVRMGSTSVGRLTLMSSKFAHLHGNTFDWSLDCSICRRRGLF